MKLSSKARYALRMMVEIAKRENGAAVSLGQVARSTQISRRYLDQLALSLKQADLIRGISGRRGGYRLTHSPQQVTLNHIVEAVIGPINIVDCVLHPETCLKADVCECRWVYSLINKRVGDVLSSLSLEELVDQRAMHSICSELESESYGCPAA